MKSLSIVLAFVVFAGSSQAEEQKITQALLLGDLSKFELTKAPKDFVRATSEGSVWRFSLPKGYSGYNQGIKFVKVVLRGSGFEIPLNAGNSLNTGREARSEFMITDSMKKSAILEIWMRSWGNWGESAVHYQIALSTIEPTSEQGVAPQSATRSESNSEGGDKPQPESKPRSR